MFQIHWFLTAISFIVVQLTHIIHMTIIIQSQSQNLRKCFQIQKSLLKQSLSGKTTRKTSLFSHNEHIRKKHVCDAGDQ